MKTLENEMTDLKKTVTEIKTLLTTKQPNSDLQKTSRRQGGAALC